MATYIGNNLSDADFESWRYKMDDRADQVATALVQSNHHHQVYAALGKIVRNSDPVDVKIFHNPAQPGEAITAESAAEAAEHTQLSALLNDYFNDMSLMPTAAEIAVINKGSEIFDDSPSECIIALSVRSLLKQYAAYRATNVLVATKLLTNYPHRRILETMQFVVDVMDVKGFTPDGCAIRAIQKLRLVHAMIRARILAKQKDPSREDLSITLQWNDAWGMPINQQDMIFAVHTFSVEVLDGLIAAGEKVSQETIDSYYLAWHYIGRALGVLPELNPTTYAEGKALQERIYRKEFTANNPNGPILAEPLMEFMRQSLPFHPSDRDIYAVIRLYNDEKDYEPLFKEILHLPLDTYHRYFLWLLKTMDSFWHFFLKIWYAISSLGNKEAFNKMLAMKDHNLMQKLIDMKKTWAASHFRIADGFGPQEAKADVAKGG